MSSKEKYYTRKVFPPNALESFKASCAPKNGSSWPLSIITIFIIIFSDRMIGEFDICLNDECSDFTSLQITKHQAQVCISNKDFGIHSNKLGGVTLSFCVKKFLRNFRRAILHLMETIVTQLVFLQWPWGGGTIMSPFYSVRFCSNLYLKKWSFLYTCKLLYEWQH